MLHLLIALAIVLYFSQMIPPKPKPKETKMTLNIKNFVPPPPIIVPKPIIIPKAQPIVKPIVKKVTPLPPKPKPKPKEIPKKKIVKETKQRFAKKTKEDNNITKVIKKQTKIKIVRRKIEKPKKVKVVKKSKRVKRPRIRVMTQKRVKRRRVKRSRDSLANALMGSGRSVRLNRTTPRPSFVSRMIKNIYGKEFNRYSPQQKKFIKNNLGNIHRVTQKTLTINGYPSVAIATQQQGTNIVSFYIHPNGDISDLRLKKAIGYASLDQNTLNVIRIAYRNYPRPQKKTKIMFYVSYSLY
ncbi:MAG: TonB family protein [Sulfurovum sp.]